MKLFRKKYRAKLKFKQPIWYMYFSLPFLGTFLILIFFGFDYLLNKLHFQFSIPISIYFYLSLLTFLVSLIIWYFSPVSLSRVQRTKRILKRIIEENNFYYANSKTNKIHSSMIISFHWEDSSLILNVYPLGGKYTAKMNELTAIFQTAFNMTVVSIQDDFADHTTYILSNTDNNYIDSTDTWTV